MTNFSIDLINSSKPNNVFSISRVELEKVTAVAFACGVLFGFQAMLPAATVIKVTILCVTSTLLSEKTIRKNDRSSWFSTEKLDRADLVKQAGFFFGSMMIMGVALRALGFAPIQFAASQILQKNLIFMAFALIAPISEEIFFRGFMKERIEDFLYSASRFESNTTKRISNVIQAILFGYIHVNEMQTNFANKMICLSTGVGGGIFGYFKDKNDGSLLESIFYHEVGNASIILRLLIFGH